MKNWKIALVGMFLFLLLSGGAIIWLSEERGLQEGKMGLDICTHCGMALTDKRYTASVIFKNNSKTLHFGDIGCLIRHMGRDETLTVDDILEGLVYDFDSQSPVPIKQAFFEKTQYQTPMASGLIARHKRSKKTFSIKELIKGGE